MKAFFKRLKKDVRGATALEYGLILALMFIAMIGAFNGFANTNNEIWNKVSTKMSEAVDEGTGN